MFPQLTRKSQLHQYAVWHYRDNRISGAILPQLAKVIGITPDGIKKQLEKLKKANRIKHVGPTKGGHWAIIK